MINTATCFAGVTLPDNLGSNLPLPGYNASRKRRREVCFICKLSVSMFRDLALLNTDTPPATLHLVSYKSGQSGYNKKRFSSTQCHAIRVFNIRIQVIEGGLG